MDDEAFEWKAEIPAGLSLENNAFVVNVVRADYFLDEADFDSKKEMVSGSVKNSIIQV